MSETRLYWCDRCGYKVDRISDLGVVCRYCFAHIYGYLGEMREKPEEGEDDG